MIDDPAEFLRQFGSRTLSYLPDFRDDGRAVVIVIDQSAHTPAGHALAVSLVNQCARLFRAVDLVGNIDCELLSPSVFGHRTLRDATLGLAREINPFIVAEHVRSVPESRLVSIGIGTDAADLPVGCRGWVASLGQGARVDDQPAGIWGAQLAACLATNAAVHRLFGVAGFPEGHWSLWEYGAPLRMRQGPLGREPLDVGRVLLAGAGAVGAALIYAVSHIDVRGPWAVCDHDLVDISNLNRQAIFRARDAGWLSEPRLKVDRAVECFAPGVAVGSPHVYGEDAGLVDGAYDVVLALANEHGARRLLQQRQPTVLLHATTSPNWQAQFHRHLAGRDDCIPCRLPERSVGTFACSTAAAISSRSGRRNDASLPQISMLAGLLLAASMVRLQVGELAASTHNNFTMNLKGPTPIAGRVNQACRRGCATRLDAGIRAGLETHNRHRMLDPMIARIELEVPDGASIRNIQRGGFGVNF